MRTHLPMKWSQPIWLLEVFGSAVEPGSNQIIVRFPYTRLLCFVARAAIFAVVIVCFRRYHKGEGPAMKKWEVSLLPELLRGLNGIELLTPDANRTVCHGDHYSEISTVVENRVERIYVEDNTYAIGSGTLDFVFVSGDKSGIRFADIALKIGGIAAVQVDLSANEPFRIPPNFQIVYISRFSFTVIAMRKISEAPPSLHLSGDETKRRMGRWLLTVSEAKKEALNKLEDVALEPPAKGRLQLHLLTRYLPDLLGDSLADYRRRVFVDVGPAGRPGSELWFARRYPTRNLDFEIIRVDVNDVISTGDSPAVTSGGAGSMTEWLRRNVREEDFVVMKAEAEAVEEMVKGRAITLVDELFLECRNQWQKERGLAKSRRAYWECLALYGKLRDEGVAVHQWWE